MFLPIAEDSGLILYRVLLDDVLSAVDSQVARQLFGMSPPSFHVHLGLLTARTSRPSYRAPWITCNQSQSRCYSQHLVSLQV